MNREYINGTKPSIKLCTAITSFLNVLLKLQCPVELFDHIQPSQEERCDQK